MEKSHANATSSFGGVIGGLADRESRARPGNPRRRCRRLAIRDAGCRRSIPEEVRHGGESNLRLERKFLFATAKWSAVRSIFLRGYRLSAKTGSRRLRRAWNALRICGRAHRHLDSSRRNRRRNSAPLEDLAGP